MLFHLNCVRNQKQPLKMGQPGEGPGEKGSESRVGHSSEPSGLWFPHLYTERDWTGSRCLLFH